MLGWDIEGREGRKGKRGGERNGRPREREEAEKRLLTLTEIGDAERD